MAVYKSQFKGSQIDNAVSVANANLNRGDSETPIYYDSEGFGQAIDKDSTVTVSSVKPLTSGGAYTGLNAVVDNSDIQTSTSLGTSGMPPSQNAAKQYLDNTAATKQDTMYGGYGIDVNGATVSVSDDVFREDEEARLHADLKVDHFGDMSVGNDSEVLELMNEAKHSTFDASKFTVVGSPVITDDGIASGFSNSYYCYATISLSGKYTIKSRAKIYDSNSLLWSYSDSTVAKLRLQATTNNILLVLDGTTIINIVPSASLSIDLFYDFVVDYDGTKYNLYIYQGDNLVTSKSSNEITGLNITDGIFKIGQAYNTLYSQGHWGGSIDLKQFSITVDGVPVFSGNKTGIDTIKPDDYTTSATPPTISEDGVMQPSGANVYYVVIPNLGVPTGSFRVEAIIENTQQGYLYGVNETQQVIPANLYFNGVGGAQWVFPTLSLSATTFSCAITNQKHKVIIGFDGTSTYYASLYNLETNIMISEKTWTSSTKIENVLGNVSLYTQDDNHKILDLNTLKIYVDGNLVYQPCLKIPYTQTKDGKKIVDSYYRSRVEDEYNQAGYIPYYTQQPIDQGNFITTGSPTISSDWIVATQDTSNYIQTPTFYFSQYPSWEIECEFNLSDTDTAHYLLGDPTDTKGIRLYRGNTNKLIWLFGGNSGWLTTSYLDITSPFSTDTNYWVKTGFTGSQYYLKYSTDGINYTDVVTAFSSTTKLANSAVCLGNRLGSDPTPNFDLKEFRVYVEGELVYTATPNYTLATVEESDIVDEYLSGATAYTQRANLQLEQQGTATSGTAVTFPKAFMDTNYALSIPYSAKTATGFTAAADGDWLAEGNVSI